MAEPVTHRRVLAVALPIVLSNVTIPLLGLVDTGVGKRHVELDLAAAGDRATVEELLASADVVVQGYRPGALEGFGDLSRPSYELGLGLKIDVGLGSVLELGLTENILVFDSSPDFGMHAGLRVRF